MHLPQPESPHGSAAAILAAQELVLPSVMKSLQGTQEVQQDGGPGVGVKTGWCLDEQKCVKGSSRQEQICLEATQVQEEGEAARCAKAGEEAVQEKPDPGP